MSFEQPSLPSVLYDLFKHSEFRSVQKGTYIDAFLKHWLKVFGIGDSLSLNSTANYFEATVHTEKGDVLIKDLSKGERKVVYLLLAIVNTVYPAGGFLKFRDIALKLYPVSPQNKAEEFLNDIESIKDIYSQIYGSDDFDEKIYDEYVEYSMRFDFKLKDLVTFYLEEPEAHLHPNNQSLLADLIVDAHYRFGIKFMV